MIPVSVGSSDTGSVGFMTAALEVAELGLANLLSTVRSTAKRVVSGLEDEASFISTQMWYGMRKLLSSPGRIQDSLMYVL